MMTYLCAGKRKTHYHGPDVAAKLERTQQRLCHVRAIKGQTTLTGYLSAAASRGSSVASSCVPSTMPSPAPSHVSLVVPSPMSSVVPSPVPSSVPSTGDPLPVPEGLR